MDIKEYGLTHPPCYTPSAFPRNSVCYDAFLIGLIGSRPGQYEYLYYCGVEFLTLIGRKVDFLLYNSVARAVVLGVLYTVSLY